jgi:hypothetical protein
MKKIAIGMMTVMICATAVWAAERPGSPLSTMKVGSAITQDTLVRAVENHIAAIQKDKGSFVMKDDVTGQQVTLTMDKINKDDVSVMGDKQYYAHGTFKGSDNKTYDIDFILKPGLIGDEIKVSDHYIHKVDGVERYQWMQDKDEWKRQSKTETKM